MVLIIDPIKLQINISIAEIHKVGAIRNQHLYEIDYISTKT